MAILCDNGGLGPCLAIGMAEPSQNTSLPSAIQGGMPPIDRSSGSIISDELQNTFVILIQMILFILTSLFGTMSNILNIVVYWRQGLGDSITVGLFALSVSDFFVVFLPLMDSACSIADFLFPDSAIHFMALSGTFAIQLRTLFYNVSCTLLSLMSVERCLCVVRPLKVKRIFTRDRTIVLTISTFLVYIIGWVPKFYAQQLRWQKVPWKNYSSYLTVKLLPMFDVVQAYHNSVMTIFVPTAAQVIVTFTATCMIHGLRKASAFRRMAIGNKVAELPSRETTQGDKEAAATGQQSGQPREKQGTLEGRDARLVKTMIVLVIILSTANVPYVALEFSQLFETRLGPGKAYKNLVRVLLGTNVVLGSINASVNAIVYYKIGSRYRAIVHEIFCSTKKI